MNEKVKQKLSGRTLVLIKMISVLFVLFLVVDSAQSYKQTQSTPVKHKTPQNRRTTPVCSIGTHRSTHRPKVTKHSSVGHVFCNATTSEGIRPTHQKRVKIKLTTPMPSTLRLTTVKSKPQATRTTPRTNTVLTSMKQNCAQSKVTGTPSTKAGVSTIKPKYVQTNRTTIKPLSPGISTKKRTNTQAKATTPMPLQTATLKTVKQTNRTRPRTSKIGAKLARRKKKKGKRTTAPPSSLMTLEQMELSNKRSGSMGTTKGSTSVKRNNMQQKQTTPQPMTGLTTVKQNKSTKRITSPTVNAKRKNSQKKGTTLKPTPVMTTAKPTVSIKRPKQKEVTTAKQTERTRTTNPATTRTRLTALKQKKGQNKRTSTPHKPKRRKNVAKSGGAERTSGNATGSAAAAGNRKSGPKGFLSGISEHAYPLLTLGKVINFFPVGDERECVPKRGYAVAAAGVCLNPYDCRQRDGRAAGDCAFGLGVCCVFEVTCGAEVRNNLTHFMSPGFPEVWPGEGDCDVTVHKMHEGITQLRIDFIHFNIGQPNSSTGECDSDVLRLDIEGRIMRLCGQNHGQHMYYNFPTGGGARDEDGELTSGASALRVRAPLAGTARVWLLRLTQLPLAHAAPHDCMQYFTRDNGTISTFNYASNGRHLADMTYRACVRRNVGRCAVQYTPCHPRAFRIGSAAGFPTVIDPAMSYAGASGPAGDGGAGTGFYGPQGAFVTGSPPGAPAGAPGAAAGGAGGAGGGGGADGGTAPTGNDPVLDEEEDPVDGDADDGAQIEGSGDDPTIPPVPVEAKRIRKNRQWKRWSPYAQHYLKQQGDREPHYYYGYGNYGASLFGYGRLRCRDRVTIPCDNDNFIAGAPYGPGVCDPYHCGASFCPDTPPAQCRVETTVSPFAISFSFGPAVPKGNPEDNIGACLRYQQMPCDT